MKLKVIGYADYDDYHFRKETMSFAAKAAIVDDLKEHGYDYSGYNHQEWSLGCPVLNDGTICRLSQRGWGGVMAEAKGYNSPWDYALFAFNVYDGYDPIMPANDRNVMELIYQVISETLTPEEKAYLYEGEITIEFPHPELGDREIYTLTQEECEEYGTLFPPSRQIPNVVYNKVFDTNINETFTIFKEECRKITSDKIVLTLRDDLKYIGPGDTVIIGKDRYNVLDVDQLIELTEEERLAVFYSDRDTEESQALLKRYQTAPIVLTLTVEEDTNGICNSPT